MKENVSGCFFSEHSVVADVVVNCLCYSMSHFVATEVGSLFTIIK